MPDSAAISSNGKPAYDEAQSAYHRAFADELAQIVNQLPLTSGMRVLDVPCGNGFYAHLLANRLGRADWIDCVDLCPAYLASTRRCVREARCQTAIHKANAYELPFAENSFDLVWCAQSLISLDHRAAAVLEMKRVLRPGGSLAILENDFFHQVLLPWPADLEVPIQRAIQINAKQTYGSSSRLTPVRRLPQILDEAGFQDRRKRTFAADRQTPWPASVRRFLKFHLEEMLDLLGNRLSPKHLAAYQRFADPNRLDSLFSDKAMDLTCLNVLYEAKKPG